MSGRKKTSNHFILSSDCETSNDGNEKKIMRQSSTNRKETRSTKQIRKRARSFIDDEAQEDDQLHTQSGSSSESIRSYIEDNVICNSVNVHDKNSESIAKMQIKLTSTTCDAISNTPNDSLASPVQTSIDRYFPTIGNSFESIENLNEYSSNFLIRGKVIYISSIRYFGTNNKVFDGIICDLTSEIKVVGFNEQVDRLYNHMKITIENGQVQKTNENFRTPYSMFEIRLTNNTNIQSYISSGFAPNIKITKTDIRNISELLNGMNVDVEGQIIFDNNVSTTVGGNNGMQLRRRSLKIKDQTGTVNITVWNNKNDEFPENVMNKNIRIRNGRINHFNDFVSINISERTIIQLN
ncbi:unnamed protein product [Adineta steineri]|uniref:Replication protein A OB domain-containing protein n=1 Tax=Adineta steineri TaxID=433720 RepID=A0A819Y8K1_9BILA|nr:unnamed protein product [Adineta steineri]